MDNHTAYLILNGQRWQIMHFSWEVLGPCEETTPEILSDYVAGNIPDLYYNVYPMLYYSKYKKSFFGAFIHITLEATSNDKPPQEWYKSHNMMNIEVEVYNYEDEGTPFKKFKF